MDSTTKAPTHPEAKFWAVLINDGSYTLIYSKRNEVEGIVEGLYPGARAEETKEASKLDIMMYKSQGNRILYIN